MLFVFGKIHYNQIEKKMKQISVNLVHRVIFVDAVRK